VLQLHPNGYKFPAGHVVKLELLPRDDPYGRVSNGQAAVQVSTLQLRLPVAEAPGALGGLVQTAAAKVVPAGQMLARDFAPPAHVRPVGATPLFVALVPAYQPCETPNLIHGAPLAYPACAPAEPASPNLTVGTGDVNGETANSTAWARFAVVPNDPGTPADEADVRITASVTDVRRAANLSDYLGELEQVTLLQITDRANGPGGEAATTVETPLRATLDCAATPEADRGAQCSVVTSADAMFPGAVQDGLRAVWELETVEVYDGGHDSKAKSTADNRLFLRQGLFLP
jgi:hypothetical protein